MRIAEAERHQPLGMEYRVDSARDRYRRYFHLPEPGREDNVFQRLMTPEQFEDLIANPEVIKQMLRVTEVGKIVILPTMREFERATGDEKLKLYEKLCRRFTDYYLLVCPCPNPDEHPGILQAEEFYSVQHIGRNPDGSTSVWLSGKPVDDGRELYRGGQRIKADELTDKEVKDAWNWLGPEGLIVHTAAAAKVFEFIIATCQTSIDHPTNRAQREVEGSKVFDGAISLWQHDHGRTLTHDPLMHMIIGQLISEDMGLPEYYREDFDLPTLLHLQDEQPLIDPNDTAAIAEKLGALALLWNLSDMYSKFELPENSPTSFDPGNDLRIRTLGSEKSFLAQRSAHYAKPELSRSFERQRQMIAGIRSWLVSPEGLNVPEAQIQKAFVLTNRYMKEFMNRNNLSFYLSQF